MSFSFSHVKSRKQSFEEKLLTLDECASAKTKVTSCAVHGLAVQEVG